MVTLVEKALRLGCYTGLMAIKLGDDSYARHFIDRDIRDVSDQEYLEVCSEIQAKLIAAGVIQPDEDPAVPVIEKIRRDLICRE